MKVSLVTMVRQFVQLVRWLSTSNVKEATQIAYSQFRISIPTWRPCSWLKCASNSSKHRNASHIDRGTRNFLLAGAAAAMVYAVPMPAMAIDETNKVINLWESDGQPNPVGTNIYWDIVVKNNSNILPSGGEYHESCKEARLYNVYSSSTPTFGTLPDFWSGSSSKNGNGAYNLTFICSRSSAYILEGEPRTFTIITYIPSTNHVVTVGTRSGQGVLQTWGLQPPNGDDFLGPIGAKQYFRLEALPATNGSISPASTNVLEGTNAEFNISADAHYQVDEIRTNGAVAATLPAHTTNTSYVWPAVSEAGTIAAVFSPRTTARGTPHWWLDGRYGLGTDDTADLGNPDADPYLTWEEYVCDTDPTNGASYFGPMNATVEAGTIRVWLRETSTGRLYRIYEASDLLSPTWRTNLQAAGTGSNLMWTGSVTNRALFFRGSVGTHDE